MAYNPIPNNDYFLGKRVAGTGINGRTVYANLNWIVPETGSVEIYNEFAYLVDSSAELFGNPCNFVSPARELTVECWGWGGFSSGTWGGGGGSYSKAYVTGLTIGSTYQFSVVDGVSGVWFKDPNTVYASNARFSIGGKASDCVGDIKYNGGNGGSGYGAPIDISGYYHGGAISGFYGGGGGSSGGPEGNGNNGLPASNGNYGAGGAKIGPTSGRGGDGYTVTLSDIGGPFGHSYSYDFYPPYSGGNEHGLSPGGGFGGIVKPNFELSGIQQTAFNNSNNNKGKIIITWGKDLPIIYGGKRCGYRDGRQVYEWRETKSTGYLGEKFIGMRHKVINGKNTYVTTNKREYLEPYIIWASGSQTGGRQIIVSGYVFYDSVYAASNGVLSLDIGQATSIFNISKNLGYFRFSPFSPDTTNQDYTIYAESSPFGFGATYNQKISKPYIIGAEIENHAPTITGLTAVMSPPGLVTISGHVNDEFPNGLTVTFQGPTGIQGGSASVPANGNFSAFFLTSTSVVGSTVTATVTDWWGLSGNASTVIV